MARRLVSRGAVVATSLFGVLPAMAAVPSPRPPAAALAHAALIDLARAPAFRMVRTAPSLRVITIVEPRAHEQAATLVFRGPHGSGTVRSIVASGMEDLRGDANGLADLLAQAGAPASSIAQAGALANTWFTTLSRVGFGPTVAGIGHVLCAGRGCSLRDAQLVPGGGPGRTTIALPSLGGRLVVRDTPRVLPVEFDGTGASAGIVLRFAYLRSLPPVPLPTSTAPLPPALAG